MRTLIFIAAFLLSASSSADSCTGNIRIFVSENAETHFNENQTSVLLPARLQLSPEIAQCAKQVYFKPLVGNDYKLEGQSGKVALSFRDASRIPLIKKPFQGQLLYATDVNSRTVIPLNLLLGSNGLITPGVFSNAFDVLVETKENQILSFTDSIQYYSPSLLAVDITSNDPKVSGTRRHYSVEMGELRTNASAKWAVNILANGRYSVKIHAENGKLKHVSDEQSDINYTLQIDQKVYSPEREILISYNQPEGLGTQLILK